MPAARPDANSSLLDTLSLGRPLEPAAASALESLVGYRVGLEGLSRLFQPSFPGVKTFAIEARAAPDQAVEISLVGIARDGRPVWTGSRAIVRGRDGSVEIHRGFDEVDLDYQSRNITTDLMQRELELLEMFGAGATSRLTIDADGVGRYVCALHGFVFADETPEGPPVRSVHAFDPDGDREQLKAAAVQLANKTAKRLGIGRLSLEATLEGIEEAIHPWDFARITLDGMAQPLADGDDGELGVSAFGRMLLLSDDTPGWRAALPLHHRSGESWRLGHEYRRRKTARSDARLRRELSDCEAMLQSSNRTLKVRALHRLGMIAPERHLPEVKAYTQSADRKVASAARQAVRQMTGSSLPDRMLRFGLDARHDERLRGLALRVLAEHHPTRLEPLVSMLRVHPDARIQRSVVPIVAAVDDAGPSLASMLAANPATRDAPRPGLEALRIELIERLTSLRDPATLPVLMAAYRRQPPPEPAEQLALSRALVVFPDPRAQTVLAERSHRAVLPPVP